MTQQLIIYNSLTRKKEVFNPINPPFVGLYVCGPTVYGYSHLGHAKSYVSFDLLYRYLSFLGYKVRYVQNITDVGHLSDDADDGEDKIERQSRVEKVEPMEVVEHYMAAYYKDMDRLNILRPSISPRPSGHITEQVAFIEELVDKNLAYAVNGSVYFDVIKYNENHKYGKLSGRDIENMMKGAASRELSKQDDKRNNLDFALWKKADPSHIMKWNSPWGEGFPGWHLECTVMSQKYLGETFDIHGGGMENMFPHHECEIAQAEARYDKPFANYWIHNNMVTVNGQKMGKSLGNSITLEQLFTGNHELLQKSYSPMTVRFFILQSHYRSTLDFSNEALIAAEKGLNRLMNALKTLNQLKPSEKSTIDINQLEENCYSAMNDDLNSPVLIAHLFDAVKWINSVHDKKESISKKDLDHLKKIVEKFTFEILGLNPENVQSSEDEKITEDLVDMILSLRLEAKKNKDFGTADKIRDELQKLGIVVKDKKDGFEWKMNE